MAGKAANQQVGKGQDVGLLDIDLEVLRKLGFTMGASEIAVMHNIQHPHLLFGRNGERTSLAAGSGTVVLLRFPSSEGDTVEHWQNVG